MPWSKEAKDQLAQKRLGAKLLSAAYRNELQKLVPEKTREQLKLQEGSTFADAIGQHVVQRALGLVSKENICFTAITELRETTEGKTADKLIATGNEELMALTRAINGPSVPVGEQSAES